MGIASVGGHMVTCIRRIVLPYSFVPEVNASFIANVARAVTSGNM
jgi:hypothetical protein